MALYADSFCGCSNATCKNRLTTELQSKMKEDLSKNLVNDLINMLIGSAKNDKVVNIIMFLLKYISIHPIEKELMDDMLKLFVVLYLKSNSLLR